MERPRFLTLATRLRWQTKAVIPIIGVLLLGLIAFEATVLTLRVAEGRWILIIAATGAVMICLVLLWVLLVLVERPLAELKRTIQRVREGNFGARVAFAGRDDDIGQLGRQFNEMIQRLAESRAEIERLHHSEMARAEHLATLGELATGLAHEIRNPLAGIAGVVDVMGKELPPGSSSRAVLSDVQDEIGYIQRILNDLLAYARPRPPQFYTGDLSATIEQAVLLARQQIRTRPIEVSFTADQDLPAISHDPAQMQQVLLNLLLNGIQAISESGNVQVTARRNGPAVIVTVADTGRGIPSEALPKIFKPFFTTRREGTGLGLSLAKGIVDAHGGSIRVTSTPGQGTQFEVSLPITRAAEAVTPATAK
jgi:signal transduction histidine kinase